VISARRLDTGKERKFDGLSALASPGVAAMTKADIIESVYKQAGFSKKESSEIVELVFDMIKQTLERGEKIKISGFGNFIVRDKKARVGRNPQTGNEIEISARRVLTFRASQVLKNVLNGLDESGKPREGGDPTPNPSVSNG
jgi:integration host factor subunit alpha